MTARADVTRRLVAAGAVIALVAVGLLVHTQLPDVAFTVIAGDALYAAAVYAGLVVLLPRASSLVLGAVAAAWCVAVEVFQLTGLPQVWAAGFPPVVLVLGTVFDPRDLVIYVVTAAVAAAIDGGIRRAAGRGEQPGR